MPIPIIDAVRKAARDVATALSGLTAEECAVVLRDAAERLDKCKSGGCAWYLGDDSCRRCGKPVA